MKRLIRWPLFILIVISVSICNAQTTPPKNFDKYVESVQKAFQIPGVSIAIVKDGKVVLAKGYGIKNIGGVAKVDSRTLFSIASNSKLFTATALALLVEEGKLEWDKPVINYLPWFQLSDPYVTREITIRDLLVHRSGLGLGAGDLLWWPPSTYDRKEITRRLRYIPLKTSFRTTYAYDNVLYTVAGEVIEAVSGKSWEEFVMDRILKKVGMVNSGVKHSDIERLPNVAAPHANINGVVRVVDAFSSDNTNPAGGVVSCAEDMAQWLICQLDSGKLADGSRLFSQRMSRTLSTMVTPIPVGDPAPELVLQRANFGGYALGLGLRDYRGKKVVSHTGALSGFYSRVTMIPELNLGIAVLTNQEISEAYNAITYLALDYYLGAQPYDWLKAYQTVSARNDSSNAAEENEAMTVRDSTSHPSLPLAKYAGTYEDAWYGEIVIEEVSGRLNIRFSHTPSLTGYLEHFQYDTYIVRWKNPELRADAYITFSLNPDGSIDRAKMKAVSPATDFSFDFHDLSLKPKKGK
jgi:CubicO group peptidase (beta-lactamase class C family)